ncbi:MAG TPA: DNA methyltransferase [Gemmataceae bacterium]|nr:DNA methyltransferase [Gemmataceae bacterium]
MADRFLTVRTEGAILPADLLQRIAAGDGNLPGLDPASYHLIEGEKLNEAANRAWNRLQSAWASFRAACERLSPTDLGVGTTRERWLLPLFQELGYGRLQLLREAFVIDEKYYPISHVWGHVPIHLVGCRMDLDKRAAGSPSSHSLVQEFLNRSEAHLWGFVSNGLKLRILRDNVRLTRQAYVEFDLQAMFDGNVYADFALLWRLCHQSRVEAEKPEDCWLERWSKTGQEQGLRILDQLRDGVEQAIAALGSGFLSCPANQPLRNRLRAGKLQAQDYYRQLLRLVYRLLFLFVAEDRELLFDPQASEESRDRYTRFYSTARLRRQAERLRGSQHTDLYQMLTLVMARLGNGGCPELGLPALGSFLFSPQAIPDLEGCQLANADLLNAVRALALTSEGGVLRSVDYRNLGSEELGSIYESLLELHPVLNTEAATFELHTASGHERKTTGSYYTPRSLIAALLDSALDPVLDEAVRGNGELGVGNRELGVGNREKDHGNPIVPRPEGLAAEHVVGEGVLPPDPQVPQGRTVRADKPDSSSLLVHSRQHCGGERPGKHKGVHPVPSDSTGQPEGVGDASASGKRSGADKQRGSCAPSEPSRSDWQDAPGTDSGTSSETPLTPTPHSRFPTPSSPEERLLSLKICDPACGSGHFLIAAAHRLAKRLASVRTGEDEPAPEAVRNALRDVIGHCLYGVDVNPMAVELCKVALWMEALVPGKPLSFLDHHIQCGNSLLGATPALLEQGIPDEAFEPIEGDDKALCKAWKKQNRDEREGQGDFFNPAPWDRLGDLATALHGLEQEPDDSIAAVRRKQERYEQLVRSSDYLFGRLWADAWCAAFVWKKSPPRPTGGEGAGVRGDGLPYPITERIFRQIEKSPHNLTPWMRDEIKRLAEQYQFFHWHLAFPDVFLPQRTQRTQRMPRENQGSSSAFSASSAVNDPGWSGGFDVVLGNPPWERIKLQEQEWFAERRADIANARNAAERRKKIEELKTQDPALYHAFLDDRRKAEGESHFVRHSGRYPLCGRGDVNTYALFAETNRMLINTRGRAGFIIQSDIATGDTYKEFFADLLAKRQLVSFYDFVNTEGLFPNIHRTHPHFCLITLSGQAIARPADFAFWNTNTGHLHEEERHFTLTAKDLELLNPNTRTCPIFRSRRDAELTKAIYRRVPVLLREGVGNRESGIGEGNPWGVTFLRMFDMANDSALFLTQPHSPTPDSPLPTPHSLLPLYEAKMLHQFDHRWATYENGETRDVRDAEKEDPHFQVQPRYWVPAKEVEERLAGKWDRRWLLGWRDITNTTNERTVIASILPRVGCGDTVLLMLPDVENRLLLAMPWANLNSFVADFVARQKVGGTHLKYHVFKQLPVLPPAVYEQPCPWGGNEAGNRESGVGNRGGNGESARAASGEVSSPTPYSPLPTPYSTPYSPLPTPYSPNLADWLLPRVLELVYTAWDLQPFAEDCGYAGPPFRWNPERRFLLRCELDAAFFHLYGISRDDAAYILDTFPIVRRKDEERYGEYRTKRVILEIYDELSEAGRTGQPYRTRLDPPPGDPRVAHPQQEDIRP